MNIRGAHILNRPAPRLEAASYKTYAIRTPSKTHMRRAKCSEVNCEHYLNGWQVRVEGLPPELLHAAKTSGRKYVPHYIAEGETYLIFEAGQACFKALEHQVPTGRPSLFYVGRGDFRLFSVRRAKRHENADDWRDDFANHQDRIKTLVERG